MMTPAGSPRALSTTYVSENRQAVRNSTTM